MLRTLSSKNNWKSKNIDDKRNVSKTLTHRKLQDDTKILKEDDNLTVLWGFILAILRARSMASTDGLQTMGVFGNAKLGFGWAKCPMMSNILELLIVLALVEVAVVLSPTNSMSSSSSETVLLWMGLRVSKQIIPSKQSSNPSLLSTLTAWTLSAFVKIYLKKEKEKERS